jgi:hypothetical protein
MELISMSILNRLFGSKAQKEDTTRGLDQLPQ